MRLGIDTGGTFTDVVLAAADGGARLIKVPSGAAGDANAILAGVGQALQTLERVDIFVHGTTLVTNALVEKQGARCALIGTVGFRDLLDIRRAHRAREGMLDLSWDPPAPLVPRRFRFTVRERVNYRGDIETPLDEESVRTALRSCMENNVEAIAVCLLNSFKNPVHERRIGEMIEAQLPDVYYTLSHQLIPVVREFERTATVAANAFVGPLLERYLDGLSVGSANLGLKSELLIMQSHGGLMSVPYARRNPVRAARSGPVAGVIAAAEIGRRAGVRNIVSFDMGGTSCDIALIRGGQPIITEESQIEFGLPVLFPSVLIDTIGAGGGTIAWIDPIGRLRSGPESAGATPGPASYGRGGDRATTTDAHVVLGTLGTDSLLDGTMALDGGAARAVVGALADQLGEELLPTAAGVIRIADSLMEQGVRKMTLQQGQDPRELALVAFGGAGPLHAPAIARSVGIPQVIVPLHPGLTSALGLLCADLRHDSLTTFGVALPVVEPADIARALLEGEAEVRRRLVNEGVTDGSITIEHTLNLKYAGGIEPESIPMRIQLDSAVDANWMMEIEREFHLLHQALRTYSVPTYPVEIESVRVEGIGAITAPLIEEPREGGDQPVAMRDVYFPYLGRTEPTKVYRRESLSEDFTTGGPAVIEQYDATTLLEPGMTLSIDSVGNICIRVEGGV